jgi:hypothetical protein
MIAARRLASPGPDVPVSRGSRPACGSSAAAAGRGAPSARTCPKDPAWPDLQPCPPLPARAKPEAVNISTTVEMSDSRIGGRDAVMVYLAVTVIAGRAGA